MKQQYMAFRAYTERRCQGNQRADLKILGDKGKLGAKLTSVARGVGKFIIARLTPDAFPIKILLR